ncbi:MAG TPA: DUF6209 family protein [Myxococcales bacterium]
MNGRKSVQAPKAPKAESSKPAQKPVEVAKPKVQDEFVPAAKVADRPPVAPASHAPALKPPQAVVEAFKTPKNPVALQGDRGFAPVEMPSARDLEGSVAVRFEANKGQPDVALQAGGKLALTYDPERTPLKGSANGIPAYGVTAFVRLEPSGKIVEKPAVAFEQSSGRVLGMPYAVPVVVDIPKGTTGVTVWFRQFAGGDRPPAEAWDSNYGRNYSFQVHP